MRQHKDCPGFLIDGFPREIQQGLQFEQDVSAPMFNTLLLSVPKYIQFTNLWSRVSIRRTILANSHAVGVSLTPAG